MPRETHGFKRGTPMQRKVYGAWANMKQRCLNPKHPWYYAYGARGITVAPLFIRSFEAFFEEVGYPRSASLSLDRRDNDWGYEPGNLRWATAKEQGNNMRPRWKPSPKKDALRADVLRMRSAGAFYQEIAKALGCSKTLVQNIVTEKTCAT